MPGTAARAVRVARGGWNYRRRRAQAVGARTAVEALAGLGFDGAELRAYERELDALAPGLYLDLERRASASGDMEAARRAARRSPSSSEGKKLLYIAVRAVRPSTAVETGTFNGASSTFILRALAANGAGRLVSFDVPEPRDALGVSVPPGHEPGWLVPPELRPRLELVLGDLRQTLRPRLRRERSIDFFFHDSLHTFRHMLFEFRAAWAQLASGGVLASDDVFWNSAFRLFTSVHRVPLRHIGTVGATRKP
jgi:predicted O-methyltransferase YrrM